MRPAALKSDLTRYATANARARSLLCRLLGRDGLEALYSYPSRTAMLEMLARSPYGPALLVHPGTEYGFAGRLIEIGISILAFLSGAEAEFIRTLLLRYELENLKLVIRAVHHRLPWETIAPHVQPLADLATVDPRALAAVADLQELTTRLEGTVYGSAAAAALHRVEAAGSFALESAIELDFYERLWAARSRLQPPDAARARTLLGMLFDLLNLAWIARYRDALALSREEILNYTLRQGYWLTAAVRALLAESAPGVWSALERTPYAACFAGAQESPADLPIVRVWRLIAVEIDRGFRVYPFHIGVPLGLLLAQEIEIRDLRVLLAAKAFGLTAEAAFDRVATVRR
ncbi:MAG TPA: V-type ATPase subunit [Candidatus Kryptonia bacterium]|nr:V-type ATPase subunit [Candidatus Kryptonia bacterium]